MTVRTRRDGRFRLQLVMKSRSQNAEQESSVVQIDTLMTRVTLIHYLDLPFDMMREDGVKVEIKVVAVIAEETQSLCFRW